MNFSQLIARLTHRFTAFRVTQQEYEFVDALAKERGYGAGPSKGHSLVIREGIALLKEKHERETKKASKEKTS